MQTAHSQVSTCRYLPNKSLAEREGRLGERGGPAPSPATSSSSSYRPPGALGSRAGDPPVPPDEPTTKQRPDKNIDDITLAQLIKSDNDNTHNTNDTTYTDAGATLTNHDYVNMLDIMQQISVDLGLACRFENHNKNNRGDGKRSTFREW